MTRQIEVHVKSERGQGATTIATLLARYLRLHGHVVQTQPHEAQHNQTTKKASQRHGIAPYAACWRERESEHAEPQTGVRRRLCSSGAFHPLEWR